jgi:hypothetical protein
MYKALAQGRLKNKWQEEFKFREFDEEGLKINIIGDEVFKQITIDRIIEPSSKLETIEVLEKLGLAAPSNSEIHRSLQRAVKS